MTTNALNGKDFTLYVGNGASPETFAKVAAIKTLKADMSRTTVDTTNKDSAGWQEMLNTASVASMKITADGIFSNSATQTTMRTLFLSGASNHFKLIDGAGNYWLGAFIVSGISPSGGYNDAQAYTYTLDSNGVIAFTAGS